MRLDEIVTVGSIDRSLRRNRVSALGATIGSVGTATAGVGAIALGSTITLSAAWIPLVVGIAAGLVGKGIDVFIDRGSSTKKVQMIQALLKKREAIVSMASQYPRMKKPYLWASREPLKRLKDDINAYTMELIKATKKAIDTGYFKTEEDIQDAYKFLSYMEQLNKTNRRPITESEEVKLDEAIIPALLVGAAGLNYLKDILAMKGTMIQIKSIYKQAQRDGRKPKEYFYEVEDYLWDAISDLGISLYRKLITEEVYKKRSAEIINIIRKKDISVLFDK